MNENKINNLPCWKGPVTIAPLSGGLSNTNYLVTDSAGKHVVRIGTDYPFHHVSRARELMTARAAHAAGFAPAVEFAADGVMVTQFLEAATFTEADVRKNVGRIGQLLNQFHALMPERITGPAYMFWVFHVIRDYANTLRQAGFADQGKLQTWLVSNAEFERVQQPLPIVFGHHDMLPANIMDDGKRLWLIDFEYAGFGTCMFDLAGVTSNAQFDHSQEVALLESYFRHKPEPNMLRAFSAMQCASLLRETLWALVSSHFLSAPGVDYVAYATENEARYIAACKRYESEFGTLTQ